MSQTPNKKTSRAKIIQRLLMSLLSLWLGWLSYCSNIAVPFIATIGGVIVLLALWFEEFGELEKYGTITHFRASKSLAKYGRELLMWGIVIEIMVGFGIAAKDSKEFSENNRLNAPINSISATLGLKVKGLTGSPFSSGMGVFVPPELDVGYGPGGITFFEGTNIQKQICQLASDADKMRWVGPGLIGAGASNDCLGVIVQFHENEWGEIGFLSTNSASMGQRVGIFNGVGSFVISLPPMRSNIVVTSGKVLIKVNSSRWEFPIPAQKPYMGMITCQITTNDAKQEDAHVLPIRIIDWVIPPRFPERLYDGK